MAAIMGDEAQLIPATLLLASCGALLIVPWLTRVADRNGFAMGFLDGFVYVAIGGLVLSTILPEAVGSAGWGALLLAAVGFAGPLFVERWLHQAARAVHKTAIAIALLGVAAHCILDGMAIATMGVGSHVSLGLPIAVVLHRLPAGFVIWWLLEPALGKKSAWAVLCGICAVTVGGYFLAPDIDTGGHSWIGFLEGLVGGSVLHVLLHRWRPSKTTLGEWNWGSGLGAFAAIAALWLVSGHEGHGDTAASGFSHTLLMFAAESAPALLLAYLCAGLVYAYMPEAGLAFLGRGGRWSQSMRGVAFGLPLPMCSCGVIPVYRSLVMRGVPPSAAMAFFVATPELGLDAIFLSFPLLGAELTLARVVCAVIVALLVGAILGSMTSQLEIDQSTDRSNLDQTKKVDLKEALRVGFADMVDATFPWILLGLVIAALLDPILQDGGLNFTEYPDFVEVLVFGLLGLPAYVCASGATPLVAVLIAHGVSPGAAIAFLLTGPATNVTTFGVLTDLHGKKIALGFAVGVGVLAVMSGLTVNAVLPEAGVGAFAENHEHGLGVFSWVTVGILILLAAASVVRQGPRGFIGIIISKEHDHIHPHGAADDCHLHDHGETDHSHPVEESHGSCH